MRGLFDDRANSLAQEVILFLGLVLPFNIGKMSEGLGDIGIVEAQRNEAALGKVYPVVKTAFGLI